MQRFIISSAAPVAYYGDRSISRSFGAAFAALGLWLACCAAVGLGTPATVLAQEHETKPGGVPTAGTTAPGERPDEPPPDEQTGVDPYANLPAPTAKPPPPSPQQDASADAQQLKGVEVQGKRDVLRDSDKRLKALQDSLPCAGCDVKPRKKKFVRRMLDKALNQVTPQAAPDGSHEVNDKAQQYSQEGQCIGAVDARRCAPTNAQP